MFKKNCLEFPVFFLFFRSNTGTLANQTLEAQTPILPEDFINSSDSVDAIKLSDVVAEDPNLNVIDTVMGLQSIAWPFIISAGWIIILIRTIYWAIGKLWTVKYTDPKSFMKMISHSLA